MELTQGLVGRGWGGDQAEELWGDLKVKEAMFWGGNVKKRIH